MKGLKILLVQESSRKVLFFLYFLKTFIEQFLETEFSLAFFFINIRNSDMLLSVIGKLALGRLPSKISPWVRVRGCFRVGNNLSGGNPPGGNFPGPIVIFLQIKNLSQLTKQFINKYFFSIIMMASLFVNVSIVCLLYYDQTRREKSMNTQAFSQNVMDPFSQKKVYCRHFEQRSIYFLQ